MPEPTRNKARWALVLSGGGAKGLAHIGVLQFLAERGYPPPSLVVGTSMGAIVGGLYACGMGADEMARFATEDFDIRRYLDGMAFQLPDSPISRVFQAGHALGNLAMRQAVDSGKKILELLEDLTGGKVFDETCIPFLCNAADLVSGREYVLGTGSVARAIRASMAFPGIFDPLEEGGALLTDGGVSANLPIHIARGRGFKRVLAVDVWSFRTTDPRNLENGAEVLNRTFEILSASVVRASRERATLTIKAEDGSSAMNFAKAKPLIALGRKEAQERAADLDAFFARGPVGALRRAAASRRDSGRAKPPAIQGTPEVLE